VWEQHGLGHTQIPIIGLHGVDDIFVPLAAQLGLPLHTITSRVGFDGSTAPYHPAKTVEDMAERYLSELRKVRPKGPYVLMGFCLGALIALEVANRLTAAGETVEFLGLFNPPPPQAQRESVPARVRRHLKAVSALSLAGQARYVAEKARGVAGEAKELGLRALRRSTSKPASTAAPAPTTLSPEQLVKQIADFGMQMIAHHVPRRYSGNLYIFHGSHWPADYAQRWSAMASGTVSTWLLPGSHLGMMEPPYVAEVASRLRDCLPAACRVAAPSSEAEPHVTASASTIRSPAPSVS
jgi:thioesterase domain-containing protein